MYQRQVFVDEDVHELNSYIYSNERENVKEKLRGNLGLLLQSSMTQFDNYDLREIEQLGIFPSSRLNRTASSFGATRVYDVQPLPLAFGLGNKSMCQLLMSHHDQLGSSVANLSLP